MSADQTDLVATAVVAAEGLDPVRFAILTSFDGGVTTKAGGGHLAVDAQTSRVPVW